MILNDVEKKILEHCFEKYEPLKPLFDKVPKPTVYRWKHVLLEEGYLEKKGSKYRTTSKGKSILKEDENDIEWDMLDKKIPHLKYITNNIQRCLVELILPSMIARRDEVLTDHHPTFVNFGPTYKGKTWIIEVLCHILGLDPVKHIHKTMAESGNSTLFRKGSNGKLVWKSEILESPLICFDEYHEAKEKVRKNNLLYVQGEKYISVENEQMKIEPVPILIYNPKKGEELGERIKFEPQHTRRAIVSDFTQVIINEKERMNGKKIMERIRDLPTLVLPPHRTDCEGCRDLVFNFLPECLKDDSDFIIDCDMVLMLCAGMTAFLPEKKAVLVVLHRYLTIIETLGYLKEDWREKLDRQAEKILGDGNKVETGNDQSQPDPTMKGEESYSVPIDLDYELGIRTIKKALDDTNVSVTDFSRFMEQYLILNDKGCHISKLVSFVEAFDLSDIESAISAIKEHGSLVAAVNERETYLNQDLAAKVQKLEEKAHHLRNLISKYGSTPQRIESLMKIQEQMYELDIDPNDTSYHLSTLKELEGMGLTLQQALSLGKEIERQGKDKDSIKKMIQCIDLFDGLENALEEKENEIQNSKFYHEIVEKDIMTEEAELKRMRKEKDALERKCKNLNETAESSVDRISKLHKSIIGAKQEVNDILSFKDEAIDMKNSLTDLKQERDQLESEVKNIMLEKENFQKDLNELKEEKERVLGWREFLFSDSIPRYNSVIRDMEMVIKISRGDFPYLKDYEMKFFNNVRKELIELFLDSQKHDLIPLWRYKHDLKEAMDLIESYKKQIDIVQLNNGL